jgi:uncharacterized membrane protein YgdD (TMEM256/DUF423 family)
MAFLILVGVSLFVAISPVLMAAGSALFTGGHMFDENSSGAYLWGLYATIPVGIVILIIGLLVLGIRAVVKRKNRNSD